MNGIIYSKDSQTIELCLSSCSELGIGLLKRNDFPTLLLDLQNNEYDILLVDFGDDYKNSLNWIRIFKKTNNQLPVIVICDNVEKIDGGKIYEAGVFNITQKPFNEEIIKNIIAASISKKNK